MSRVTPARDRSRAARARNHTRPVGAPRDVSDRMGRPHLLFLPALLLAACISSPDPDPQPSQQDPLDHGGECGSLHIAVPSQFTVDATVLDQTDACGDVTLPAQYAFDLSTANPVITYLPEQTHVHLETSDTVLELDFFDSGSIEGTSTTTVGDCVVHQSELGAFDAEWE
jgi:hypothetical protein